MHVPLLPPGDGAASSITLLDVIALNACYGDALDRFDLAAWKALFTPGAVYRAQARENFDRSLPLAAIYLDGHGMMADRITGIEKTLVFAPRSTRQCDRFAGAGRRPRPHTLHRDADHWQPAAGNARHGLLSRRVGGERDGCASRRAMPFTTTR